MHTYVPGKEAMREKSAQSSEGVVLMGKVAGEPTGVMAIHRMVRKRKRAGARWQPRKVYKKSLRSETRPGGVSSTPARRASENNFVCYLFLTDLPTLLRGGRAWVSFSISRGLTPKFGG